MLNPCPNLSAYCYISIQEERIVVTKDTDFFDSFLIRQQPYKLLLVSTGNITNAELEVL
jgi:predicted nuclease of predicted toxin-antitoxin system